MVDSMADLRLAVDQLNNGKNINVKLNGMATIYNLCAPDVFPESSPHEAARKGSWVFPYAFVSFLFLYKKYLQLVPFMKLCLIWV